MMKETNITNKFKIYRSGKLDRAYEARKITSSVLRLTGRALVVSGVTVINVVDELVTEYQKL